MITLDYSDDYSEFEYEIDSSDILEFLLNLDKDTAEDFVKENNYNLEDIDLYDALQELSNDDDAVKEYFEDELKEFFREDAMEQKEFESSDDYSYRGISRRMFY